MRSNSAVVVGAAVGAGGRVAAAVGVDVPVAPVVAVAVGVLTRLAAGVAAGAGETTVPPAVADAPIVAVAATVGDAAGGVAVDGAALPHPASNASVSSSAALRAPNVVVGDMDAVPSARARQSRRFPHDRARRPPCGATGRTPRPCCRFRSLRHRR
jgi:hypothetical protein